MPSLPRLARPSPGLAAGLGAYLLWGLLPLYMHQIATVPPIQFVAMRVLFSLGGLVLLLLAIGRLGAVLRVLATPRLLAMLSFSALMIGTNWLIYIWAVERHHVLEASLGYFINPLVNVLMGTLILGERLRRLQWLAVALAFTGALILGLGGGAGILIALSLALTFATYGLIRKLAPVDALAGLAAETAILAPVAAAVMLIAAQSGTLAFGHALRLDLLLVASAPITTVPLLLFAAAARRLPLSTLGFLQYVAPSLQFAEAVLLLGEPVTGAHMVTFGLIWTAVALFAWDAIATNRGAALPAQALD